MLLLIPWSFGWTTGIDVQLTRMLFWYFGHPLVYFWIMGAYVIWYTVLPRILGTGLQRLADAARVHSAAAALDCRSGSITSSSIPASRPAGRWLHIVYDLRRRVSVIHDGLRDLRELRNRARASREKWLPPDRRAGCPGAIRPSRARRSAMILFIFGGFGGIVNTSYSMDILVHNTMWIVGHFHITVGGPVALSFIGAAYRLVPAVTGRKLFAPKLALLQTWLWFIGMCSCRPRCTSPACSARRGERRT